MSARKIPINEACPIVEAEQEFGPVPLRTSGSDHTWSLDDVEVVRAALRAWSSICPTDRQRALDLCEMINRGFETVTRDIT